MNSVSEEDIKAIFEALLRKAKGGDVQACREVLDRLVGKAPLLIEGTIVGVPVLTEKQRRRADEIVRRIDAVDD